LGCQIGLTAEGAVNVALEVCVVEEFERVTTPADYLAAAREIETFEWVKEGHERVPVEKDAVHNGKEFWAILGAAIACDDVTFEREARVGSIKDVVIMSVFFARETERIANV